LLLLFAASIVRELAGLSYVEKFQFKTFLFAGSVCTLEDIKWQNIC